RPAEGAGGGGGPPLGQRQPDLPDGGGRGGRSGEHAGGDRPPGDTPGPVLRGGAEPRGRVPERDPGRRGMGGRLMRKLLSNPLLWRGGGGWPGNGRQAL